MKINKNQQKVIESTKGIYLVDAGAGTGKTFAITKRYEHLLSEGVEPKDILLLTFTNNAAENMREKIINSCYNKHDIKELLDAPISTFHSFCNNLLKNHGFDTPSYLGIKDSLSNNFQILENKVIEQRIFNSFFQRFQKNNLKKYKDIFSIIDNKSYIVIKLIKKLCCNGILPKKQGWFNNGYEMLKGDISSYMEIFEKINSLNKTPSGNTTDSDIAHSFKSKLRYKPYHIKPDKNDIFENKSIRKGLIEEHFKQDRKKLIDFMHDIYFQYLEYSIKKNKLNFDFVVMLAFILLYENNKLRKSISFEYIMVDEFQDTNEIQFMITLLLMNSDNLCVVGDWKQGIYSFRNATIENITNFDKRLLYYKDVLNKDKKRIDFDVKHKKLSFDINYRSSQKILNFSEKSLLIKGSNREKIDKNKIKNNITHLKSGLEYKGKTDIEFLKTEKKEDEPLLILQKINKIVDNPDYSIREFDGENYIERKVKYKDIAVLSRTRTFGLKLQNLALKYNIPLNYDGGVELFKTEPSILVLAWLKLILNKEKISAWIPILEKEGYNYQEIKIILQNKEKRPKKILSFREELLKEKKEINNIIARILDFYNFNNTFSNALISEISNTLNSSLMSLSDLIYFIEQNIESAQTYNININNSDDAVTVETIHAAKGLEYPVVFIVDCNNSRFPSKNIGEPILFYDEILGLRSKKHKARKNNYNYIFNNLATDLLLTNLHSDFDEERRLLYVAITRAKQYVIFTANKNSSLFFEEMSDNFEVKEQNINEIKRKTIHKKKINDPITIKEYRKIRNIVSPHYFMNLKPSAQGPERGKRLHIIAERIAKNKQVKDSENTRKLKDFIDSFKGILKPELKFYLPFNNYLIRGQIDLVVFEQNKIIIVDYKTDKNNINQKEYQKQLSFYYAALKKIYPEKDIKCILFYIPQNKQVEIEPIELSNIIKQ